MKFIFLLLVGLFFLQSAGYSQSFDSLRNIYNNLTIYRAGNMFIKGGTKFRASDLSSQFTSPETVHLYRKARKLSTVGTIFSAASAGLAIYSTLSSHKQIVNIEIGATTGILGIIGILIHTKASAYLDKAIWTVNKETLFNINH